ncbi:5472_t:CDS:2, partial [Rhizophagus irregularis]
MSNFNMKRRKVAEEFNEKREVHLERDWERKRRKVAEESNEEREAHLERDQKRKRRKVAEETNETRLARDQKRKERQIPEEIYEEYEARLEAEEEVRRACARNKYQLRKARKTPKQFAARLSQNKPNIRRKRVSESSGSIQTSDRKLLRKFRSTISNFTNKLCNKCNERFPSITLIGNECRRCHLEGSPKKFSTENNMDPGEVPQELQDLTDIEEMLIAQVFPIVSVYNLPGGQYAYCGNIINFPQDVQERYTENGSNFRDFHVRREKVMQALRWLKTNNKFYRDIEIDSDVLQTLPENDSIEMHLSQLIDDNDRPNEQRLDQVDDENNEDNEDNFISQNLFLCYPTNI